MWTTQRTVMARTGVVGIHLGRPSWSSWHVHERVFEAEDRGVCHVVHEDDWEAVIGEPSTLPEAAVIGEKDDYVERALRNVTPNLQDKLTSV